MNTIEAIKSRRAVKQYDPAHVIPAQDEAVLLDAIRQSPTSFNIQNWRIVNVKDKSLRAEIRKAAWDQAQVTDSSLLFVFCGDLKAWEKNPARYWETAPKDVQDFLSNAIINFYKGREWQARDEAMRSIGFAAQSVMLAAKTLGYDSCPMIGFDAEIVGKLINLPKDHVVGMMISVGRGVAPARSKGGYIPHDEVFITDRFK